MGCDGGAGQPELAGWRGVAADTARCLRFYSRLRIPTLPFEGDPHAAPDFATATRMLPVAGALIGSTGALVLVAGSAAGLPALAAAALATAALVMATGAFHEDGLADTADGLGGGMTPQRRLEIMTDSRFGTYGGVALVLSLLLRVVLLAAILERAGAPAAAAAIVALAALSRTVGLVPIWLLPNAKPDGKSAAVGRPGTPAMAVAGLLSAAIVAALLVPAFGAGRALAAACAGALAAWPMVRLSRRLIGGQTGDVAGAVTMLAELAGLLVLAAR